MTAKYLHRNEVFHTFASRNLKRKEDEEIIQVALYAVL